MELKDKIILITGGSSGIGKASALLLAKEGATIILQARSIDKLQKAVHEIETLGGKAYYYSTDLKCADAIEKTADQMIEEIGLPDVIINSAGEGEWLSLKEATLAHFKETIESPYLATAYTCKVFYDRMKERCSRPFYHHQFGRQLFFLSWSYRICCSQMGHAWICKSTTSGSLSKSFQGLFGVFWKGGFPLFY